MTRQGRTLVAWAAAALALAAVFAAYFDPRLVFGLATQLWNCF